MQSNIPKYLATISPYSNVFKQPHVSASATITGAVYLFRHGILEVSQHDYSAWIAPFLRKLEGLQRAGKPFVQGRLEFLAHYRSWISAAHVGMVSEAGLQQSSDLGTAFRTRYKQWLVSAAKEKRQNSSLAVWTDAAARCHRSATAFAGGFSGILVSRIDWTVHSLLKKNRKSNGRGKISPGQAPAGGYSGQSPHRRER